MKYKKTILMMIFCYSIQCIAQSPTAQNELPIGVFDSGTGGLTVLQAILTLDAFNNITGEPGADGKLDFENEFYQYLADQANMPYGNYAAAGKTDLLKEHMMKNLQFFIGENYDKHISDSWMPAQKPPVKMVVLACNTATAYTLTDLKQWLQQQHLAVPCIGVIDAGSKAALIYYEHNPGTIGVFATAGTVTSGGYPRALRMFAKQNLVADTLSIISEGGVGLAESIDRDWDYFNDTLSAARQSYKGPSLKNKSLLIDTSLLAAYHFNTTQNELLCEYDEKGSCLDMQLNAPSNYVRYHLVSMLEQMKEQNYHQPLSTLILGCTHYPYMRDTIQAVLNELYNFQQNGNYVYRQVLAPHVELIDPAVETAKQAWLTLHNEHLQANTKHENENMFLITVPNTQLKEVKLQTNGSFTYEYKYGRVAGAGKKYVQTEMFSTKNISGATFNRFKQVLPDVYTALQKVIPGLK